MGSNPYPPPGMSISTDSADTARARLLEMLAIGLGGAFGSTLRSVVSVAWSSSEPIAAQPVFLDGTLIVNTLGALLLGLTLARRTTLRAPPWIRPFLTVGFLGSLTTWSTLAAASHLVLGQLGFLESSLRLFAMLGLGLGAFWLGDLWGRRLDGEEN